MPDGNYITQDWMDTYDSGLKDKALRPLYNRTVVHTLAEAPDATTLGYIDSGQTYLFKPGDEVRTPGNGPGGYDYYKLYAIDSSTGDAVWYKTSTSGETVHIVTDTSYTAGDTTSGAYDRAIWYGNVDVKSLYTGLMIQLKTPGAGCKYGTHININNLGEHPVVLNAATAHTTHYPAGSILVLIYDADQTLKATYVDNVKTSFTGCWKIHNYDSDKNTTYTPATLGFGYGTCTPPTSGVACAVTLSSYELVTGGIVAVKFSTNDVPASATLNINSKGAKKIYYNGAAIGADVIKAGDTAVFMYHSQYHLLSIDRTAVGV